MLSTLAVEKLIENKICLAIMGPTASGKSGLSMALAQQFPIEVISVDSALIYRGMDIGTAKPTVDELKAVPHHLIDILEPTEQYSAADFIEDVTRLVAEIFQRGRLPVLVGGTMMYFNALQQGIAQLPSANPEIRQKIYQAWQQNPQAVHEKLQAIDPVAANRIHANDSQRLVRALEVYELTGQSLTEAQKAGKQTMLEAFQLAKVALLPEDRKQLHAKIAQRFQQILADGFLKEAERVFSDPGMHADLPAVRSVGYRQAWLFFEQVYDYDTFVEKSVVATRQLAKRQMTWLRKESDLLTLDPFQLSIEQQVETVIEYLQTFCGTPS
ncbi:tRNA (adenosine(37)-N6)-dimethylallyltransferase MiaA [Hydrogenovibrio sp. SC-1]|uniref:tRNA (adenosine(37)-N6)-dimethylallyltransferase MiaA n=1 Tax=Hydrogenovibrio sp. SC-1 TaxID=2065820 RepID=UPI001E42989B|nr:tRNA (adenosine(37)-N6)-dimethylallyltransferase MiaA [Hydrogenovibrio sp. SC-1]